MYDYIKGAVTRITPEYITLEQGGIGYQLNTPNPYAFHKSDEIVHVYTHLQVREDAHVLFGFVSLEQRELFRKLIQVSGIGPKGALAIVGSGAPNDVVTAIEQEDEKFLTKFPGVGKKTARQMILDLKGKLNEFLENIDLRSAEDELPLFGVNPYKHELDEAKLALQALGYSDKELEKITPVLEDDEQLKTTEAYMKQALKLLLKLQ